MKQFPIICILLFFFGCNGDIATFDKPQPSDGRVLAAFPVNIRGSYFRKSDQSMISVSSDMIVTAYDFDYRGLPGQLDSAEFELHHDTLVNRLTDFKQKVTYKGDSIFAHLHLVTDTMFAISNTNVLKKDKGYYFLNDMVRENEWTVHIMSLRKGMLTIGYIRDSADIKLLKDISGGTGDSTGYHFNPSRKQLESFVKQNGFRERDTFYWISR